MQGTHMRRHTDAPAALGIVLVIVGVAAFALRQAGVDVANLVEDAGWQFFIIIPGLFLLAMAVVTAPPRGLGFAIAGSIVTTVGLILLYQESADHWESWAYAWALIPGAAGVATTVYGLASRSSELVANGLRLAGVAGVLFVAGFWLFETIFESGRVPADLGTWLPVLVTGLGALIIVSALMGSSRSTPETPAEDAPTQGGNRP